jgi:ZIP family zinc transporter
MAIPAFLFVAFFEPLLPIGLGFARGAMICMIFSEIMPDALDETWSNTVAAVITLSVAAMVTFRFLIR